MPNPVSPCAALLSTAQAAERLGVSPSRIQQLARSGELRAERVGRDWLIPAEAVARFRRQPPGRRWPAKDGTKPG